MRTSLSNTKRFVSAAMNTLGLAGLSLLGAGVIASLPWSDEQLAGGQTLGSLLIGNAGALTVEMIVSPPGFPARSATRGERPETETRSTL
jgi:hypothetical protein